MKRIFAIICFFLSFVPGLGTAVAQQSDSQTAPEKYQLIVQDNRVKLPLQSVLVLALKNNLDISFAGLQPDIAATKVTQEESAYDTLFTSQFSKYHDRVQTGSALTGSSSKAETYSEQHELAAALQKKFTPGTLAELKMTHQEFVTDVPFVGLKPQYFAELTLSLTQPLLRDFGIEVGKSQIRIARLNHQGSEYEFKKNVMDILLQVESFYWDLYFSIEDLKSKKKSLSRAEDLLREFKIRIDAGTLAPIEIYQAKAEVALRSQDVIVAEAAVTRREDNLKSALNLYDDEAYWNIVIIPQSKPTTERMKPDLYECVATALEKRPDFMQAKLNVQASNIQVKYTKNQTLPRVDLFGTIGTSGLAGRPQDTSGVFGPFFRSSPSPWSGHWEKVYDGLADTDYYKYTIGIKIEVPFENRLAKSFYSRAKVQATQALTNLKKTENNIINEVRDAIRIVVTSQKVIDSATASLKLAQEKLKAEHKKYKVGMSTTHDVLEFQEDLSMAESTLAFAQTEYSKSLANLARAMGVLLENKDLTL